MIYPESVNLICQAIESDYLYSFNIVNDENLFGFHLADQVNQYSVNEHFDLDKNFEHKKLSEPQNMGNVPIPNNEAIIRHTRCTLQHSKVVDGILYWYELIMNDQIKIDTSACTHYNYACFLVTRQETQQDRSDLTICTKFYQGLIKIHCEMCLLISL
ncbi:hypothetical protein QE152_g29699 [Popillia japonica]|uniref:Uncharacterized protein n=1 Tax=Popillia japonica TaxID=7064 RepID=A0AAW1JH93_POPJA